MPDDDLTGWPLSVALAEALGWQRSPDEDGAVWWLSPSDEGRPQLQAPAYHESLDALFRDVVPALRERGWDVEVSADASLGSQWLALVCRTPVWVSRVAETPAEALCRAALAALREGA